jgi:dihydroorotate dehydrogenase electron transfer subunit
MKSPVVPAVLREPMDEAYLEIVSNENIAQDTYLMDLRSPEIAGTARPGQFVMVRVIESLNPFLRRPFSICGIQGNDIFRILYRVVGRGTNILSKTPAGRLLRVLGPLGKGFRKPKSGDKALLVGGGIGLAPLLFLAQKIETSRVKFFLGYGTAGSMFDMEQIGLGSLEIQVTTEDGTMGQKGLVTDLLESRLEQEGREGLEIFACGPSAMLRVIARMAIQGAIPCQVCLETQMACGIGACQGCVVPAASKKKSPYYRVCSDGPVFHVEALDWEKYE